MDKLTTAVDELPAETPKELNIEQFSFSTPTIMLERDSRLIQRVCNSAPGDIEEREDFWRSLEQDEESREELVQRLYDVARNINNEDGNNSSSEITLDEASKLFATLTMTAAYEHLECTYGVENIIKVTNYLLGTTPTQVLRVIADQATLGERLSDETRKQCAPRVYKAVMRFLSYSELKEQSSGPNLLAELEDKGREAFEAWANKFEPENGYEIQRETEAELIAYCGARPDRYAGNEIIEKIVQLKPQDLGFLQNLYTELTENSNRSAHIVAARLIELQTQLTGELPQELFAETLSSSVTHIIPLALAHWKMLSAENQSQFLIQIGQHRKVSDLIEISKENRIPLSESFIYSLTQLPAVLRSEVIKSAVTNNVFTDIIPYFQILVEEREQDNGHKVVEYIGSLVMSVDPDQVPKEIIDYILQSKENTDSAVLAVVLYSGAKGVSLLPTEVLERFVGSEEPLDSQTEARLWRKLAEVDDLCKLDQQLLARLSLTGDTLFSILDNYPQSLHDLPAELQAKIGSIELKSQQALKLLHRAIRSGEDNYLDQLGGIGYAQKVLNLTSGAGEYEARSLLETAIEADWDNVPSAVKELILSTKWTYVPDILLETADIRFIAQFAERSGLTFKSASESFNGQHQEYLALFAGADINTVQNVLESESFRIGYPEFYELAQERMSSGERALILRCAYKGYDIKAVSGLLKKAEEQLVACSTPGLSALTELDKNGIYFEKFLERFTKFDLTEAGLKNYINSKQEEYTPESIIRLAVDAAHLQNFTRESIFWLIEHAKLKDGVSFTQDHYADLCRSLLPSYGKFDGLEELFDELEAKAGWDRTTIYKELLRAEATNGWGEMINGIILRGNLSPSDIKEISLKYLDTKSRFSASTLAVYFKYLNGTEFEYSAEEKRLCWERFKQNMLVSIDVDEIEFFAKEGIIGQQDYDEMMGRILTDSTFISRKFYEYFIDKCVTTPERAQHFVLQLLEERDNEPSLDVMQSMYIRVKELNAMTPQVIEAFTRYMQKDLSFTKLTTFIEFASEILVPEQVTDKIVKMSAIYDLPNDFEVFQKFGFTSEQYREIASNCLHGKSPSSRAFKLIIDGAQYSEAELIAIERELLFSDSPDSASQVITEIAERLPLQEVADLLEEYLVNIPVLNTEYYSTLASVVNTRDSEAYIQLWERVRERKPEYNFFQSSPLRKELAVHDFERTQRGYIFEGKPQVENPEDLQEVSSVYYHNHLIFWENMLGFSKERVRAILGAELFSQLEELKQKAASIALERQAWFVSRERAIPHFTIGGHGTYQAETREAAPTDQETTGAIATVKAITQGPDGIGIRGEKATRGAFFNPCTRSYGNVESGTMVLFFTDDLLESHIGISYDPMKGDGTIARDSESGRLVQIPNRVLLNPQGGKICDMELNNLQMAEYIMTLRYELSNYPELVKAIEDAALLYERENLGESFIKEVQTIHLQTREFGYPEGAILWARDYYTSLAHSDDQDLFKTFQTIVKGIEHGKIKEDIRGVFDNIRMTWNLGLREEVLSLPVLLRTPQNIIRLANTKLIDSQRKAFTTAVDAMRTEDGAYVGVARQHTKQVAAATKAGDIPARTLRENLAMTRAVFIDSVDREDASQKYQQIEKLAGDLTAIKQSVLQQAVSKSIRALSTEERELFRKYRDKVAFCSAGSIGRGEAVISSDLDYLIMIDNSTLSSEEVLSIRRILARIGDGINSTLETEFDVRPDAGLANASRQPVLLLSEVNELSIDTFRQRQSVEPTEIFDSSSIFKSNRNIVNRFQRAFTRRAQEIVSGGKQSLGSYIARDVEKYATLYNASLSQFMSGDQILDFKQYMQRVFQFQVYAMVSEAIEKGNMSTVPNTTLGKIEALQSIGRLDESTADSLRELQLMFYKLRYRADVLSSAETARITATSGDNRAKVTARFDPRAMTVNERTRMLELLGIFNNLSQKQEQIALRRAA